MKASVPPRQPRRNLPATVLAVAVILPAFLLSVLWVAPAGAQNDGGDHQVDIPPSDATFDTLDEELLAALELGGFLDEWYQMSPVHPTVALAIVEGEDHVEPRQELLDQIILLDEQSGEIVATTQSLLATEGNLIVVKKTLVDRRTTLTQVRVERRRTEIERNRQLDDLVVMQDAIRAAAVAAYMGEQVPVLATLDNVQTYNDAAREAITVETSLDDLVERKQEIESTIASLNITLGELDTDIAARITEIGTLEDREAELADALVTLKERIVVLQEALADLRESIPENIEVVHEARMLGNVPILEAPLVVLDAYVKAAENVKQIHTGCGLRWQMLAGIAKVETGHGTFRGSEVLADGHTSKRILGPLLNGTLANTAIITDTDGGILDGNASFDAAVGPFQFIPGTWKSFDWDGNGDQIANPHNMYDGALSAAVYLCLSGPMVTDAEITRGVLTYNESDLYVALTTAFADHYSDVVLPSLDELPAYEIDSGFEDAEGEQPSDVPPFGRGTLPVPPPPGDIAQSTVATPPADQPGDQPGNTEGDDNGGDAPAQPETPAEPEVPAGNDANEPTANEPVVGE